MSLPSDKILLRLAVGRGLVTSTLVEAAEREARDRALGSPVDLLVERGALSPDAVAELRKTAEDGMAAGLETAGTAPDTSRPAPPVPADDIPVPAGRFGKYELREELGRGAMGVVYRAVDTELGRDVALKTVLAAAGAGQEQVERLLREARTAAMLEHPGIVPVYDVGTVDGVPYLAMGLVQGKTLQELMKTDALGSVRDRVRLLHAAVAAVAHAHGRQVIHRDLKPGNLMVDNEGVVRVLDFGLARRVDDAARLTVTGQVVGTPAYMAPEQVDDEEVGPPADVWALGAVLYELLTGRMPFRGATIMEIMRRVVMDDPVPLRKIDRRIPPDLETVCLKALNKEPGQRYASAGELAEDLRLYLAGEAVHASPERTWTRSARWLWRRKTVTVPGVFLILIAVVLGLWGWRHRVAEQQARTQAWQSAQRAEGQRRALLEKARAAVLDFEDAVMSLAMSPQVQTRLAGQPLGILDELIRLEPGFGPAYAWRGEVMRLLGREREAEEAFDRGCALSPESAVVWYLRGRSRLRRYADTHGLSGGRLVAKGVEFDPVDEASEQQRNLRESGLADLARMTRASAEDPLIGEEDVRLARAIAAVHQGDEPGYRTTCELLAGIEHPRAWRLLAAADYQRGRFAEAAEMFDRVLAAWPFDVVAWDLRGNARNFLGVAMARRGEDPRAYFRTAIADLDKAVQLNPDHAGGYGHRSLVWKNLGDEETARGGDPREGFRHAIEDCDQVVKLTPGDAGAHSNRGSALLALGAAEAERGGDPRPSLRRAMADIDEALRLAPRLVTALINRGNAHLQWGNAEAARDEDPREHYRSAIAACSEAVQQDPNYTPAYFGRGNAHSRLARANATRGVDPRDDLRRATADFDAVLSRDPEDAKTLYNRGNAYTRLGDRDAAVREDPRESYRRAIADYSRALEINPGYPMVVNNRGNARLRLAGAEASCGVEPWKLFQEAADDYAELLRLDPENAGAYICRGNVYLALGQAQAERGLDPAAAYGKAEADYRAAQSRNDPAGWLNLGRLYGLMGRVEDAIAAFEAGARAAPQNREWAEEMIRKTREQAGSTPQQAWIVLLRRAGAAMAQGDHETARAAYQEGLALFDRTSAALTEPERANLLADAQVRALRVDAYCNLARVEATASGQSSAPEEAARLRDAAFRHLGLALDLGWTDRARLETEADLAPLRSDPRWSGLLGRLGR